MPRPINLCRLRRTERPVWKRRDWLYDPWLQHLWVWLEPCPNYDRHRWWRFA